MNGRDWSEEAVGWFQAMVHNRTLYSRLYPQGPKVTVELFLEKGKLGAMRCLSMKHGWLVVNCTFRMNRIVNVKNANKVNKIYQSI